ncbi:saccharopine dehydrogenase family protein [Micromonospora sp. NPDC000089]|uniref:saccharopine dehydrogenase family protein n=1 Tax=unclassified Micromonospora TaxID=2617518 RepID=UPI0036786E52
MDTTIVIYGATGYIGRLCAREAVERGLHPLLAGRDRARLAAVGEALSLPVRVAELDDPAGLDRLLDGAAVLLNAAGPFVTTQPPLLDACLRTGTHYLDLSGEAPEFLTAWGRDADCRAAGVMAMPGVGFGVVPTDAMAVHLARRLPGARRLELSFVTRGGLSRGTVGTLLAGLPTEGVQRRNGRLVPTRAGAERRRITHEGTTSTVVTNPWRADVVSAGLSTGIPDIATFFAAPPPVRALLRLGYPLRGLLTRGVSVRARDALLRRLPAGPTDAQLADGASLVHGVVTDDQGRRAEAVLEGPEPYLWTARTAAEVSARTAAGVTEPGYRTPAQVHGPQVALTGPDVRLRDVR